MQDSTKKIIYIVLAGLPTLLVLWLFGLYFFGCGTTNTCTGIPQPDLTPIPTLLAATMPAPKVGAEAAAAIPRCHISALNLIGAWVDSGFPETDAFKFTDSKGTNCTGTFKDDVQKLFITPNLWYDGATACTTCHYADIAKATKNMDLSSYAGIVAGSNRLNDAAKGTDILGGGKWADALLRQMLYAPGGKTEINRPPMPLGRPATVPAEGPIISAGLPTAGGETAASGPTPSAASAATAVPAASTTPESAAATPGTATQAASIARPSNPGGAGIAITLKGDVKSGEQLFTQHCVSCHADQGKGGVANPGSSDGTVPPLNPIDPTIKDANPVTFAYNIDLFIEHGSTPTGTNPQLKMPDWGDSGQISPQQIADLIAYIISLNN